MRLSAAGNTNGPTPYIPETMKQSIAAYDCNND